MSDSQVDVLSVLAEQEILLVLPRFTTDDAFAIGSLIRSNFLKKYSDGTNGAAISIELFNGDTLFKASVGNKGAVTHDNWEWIKAKTRVVARFNHASYFVGRKAFAKKPEKFGTYGPVPIGGSEGEYSYHGGAIPLWIKGVTVGPIGVVVVSGLPQEVDHQLAVDSIAEYYKIEGVPSVLKK